MNMLDFVRGTAAEAVPAPQTEIVGSFACGGPYVVANAVHHGRPRQ